MKIPRFILWIWFKEKLLKLKIRDAILKWYFKRKVSRGVYVLKSLDGMMAKAGYKRSERRKFWRDIANRQDAREKLFDRMGNND